MLNDQGDSWKFFLDNEEQILAATIQSGQLTPEQIATASIEAAKAGAAIAHIHVREEDGTPSRR